MPIPSPRLWPMLLTIRPWIRGLHTPSLRLDNLLEWLTELRESTQLSVTGFLQRIQLCNSQKEEMHRKRCGKDLEASMPSLGPPPSHTLMSLPAPSSLNPTVGASLPFPIAAASFYIRVRVPVSPHLVSLVIFWGAFCLFCFCGSHSDGCEVIVSLGFWFVFP